MNKKIFSGLLGIALLTGCAKDPVNVAPTNQYSLGSYPASVDDLNSVLAASYANLRDPNLFGFNLLPKALANATHATNCVYAGDPFWNEMAATNLTVANSYVDGAWQMFYSGVKDCNATLSGADFFSAKYAKPTDIPSVNLIRGQAYFLRAFYYFNLECYFGEDNITSPTATDTMGVPLVTALPTSLAGAQLGRSSIKAVWAQIESDLNQAATLLKGQVWTGNDVDRVTEWSAKALLGKSYLFTKDYNDAKTTLLDVINNSGRSLMPYTGYMNSFLGVASAKGANNTESLFVLNIDGQSFGDYGVYGGTPNSTSIMGLIWCPWSLGADGTESGASPMGYGNEVTHDKNITRFGFNLGYYNLVSNPNFNSSMPASYNNPVKVMDPTFKANSLAARTNNTVDPRLWVNCLQPWVDSVMPDGKTWYPVSKPSYYLNGPTDYGWSIRKYAPVFNNINNLGPADVSDIYFIRLADVYLLYAEACMNSSDNADALTYLNMVKRRAYNYPVNAASPVDYQSLTSQTAAIGDPVLGNNPLYYERWAELFNEGQWWFDICRWHLGASEAAYYGTAINATSGPLTFNSNAYAWPIPLNELNSNPAIQHQQNPGY